MTNTEDEMKSMDEATESETERRRNKWGDQKWSHNTSLLLPDQWKPCQRTRATVKG